MRTLIIFSLFLIGTSSVFGQANGKNGLTVKGIVTQNGRPLDDAGVRVYNGKNRIVEHDKTENDGRFRIRLALNGYYVVEFGRSGTVSKRLLFQTKTPDQGKVYHPFELEIALFDKKVLAKDPDIDLDLPLGIIEYFPEKNDFDYVKDYTRKSLKEQKEMVSKIP